MNYFIFIFAVISHAALWQLALVGLPDLVTVIFMRETEVLVLLLQSEES
jgi:hypothetical protein